jgi:cell division protein FtsQ
MSTTTPVTPIDIRLMNVVSALLLLMLGALLLVAGLNWAMQQPVFAIRGVSVTGDVAHYNAITLRANVMPRLQGTFFTLDVKAARKVFETMPWVRRAIVRREFPNRLKVQLQEHQAVAYWGTEIDNRLVNSFGEVFEANVGELEQEQLPRLNAPDGQSALVLAHYQRLKPLFDAKDLALVQLELSPRGAWRAQLDSGAELELGGGNTEELLARTQRFLSTITQVTAGYKRLPNQLASVDLRHTDGYAIRLEGVSTLEEVDKRNTRR